MQYFFLLPRTQPSTNIKIETDVLQRCNHRTLYSITGARASPSMMDPAAASELQKKREISRRSSKRYRNREKVGIQDLLDQKASLVEKNQKSRMENDELRAKIALIKEHMIAVASGQSPAVASSRDRPAVAPNPERSAPSSRDIVAREYNATAASLVPIAPADP